MIKRIFFLTIFIIVFNGCHSCYMTQTKALEFISPIINVIQTYKKTNKIYPNDLTRIKNFPYQIAKYPNKNAYYFLKKKAIHMKIEYIDQKKLYLKIDFLNCTSARSIHSVAIEFSNNTYLLHYFKIAPNFKQ